MSAQHVVTAVMSSWGFNFYPLILLNSRIESNIKLNALRAEHCSAGEIPVRVKLETGGQDISGHQSHTYLSFPQA